MNDPYRNLVEEITWIGQQGFDYIDLALEAPNASLEGTDWKGIASVIQDAGLGVVCHAAHYLPLENPSSRVRQAALDEVRRAIDAAQLVGARVCTTRHCGWPAYLSDEAGYEYYRQLYDILIRHGQERGVAVALENSPRNQHQLKHFREIFHRLPQLKLHYNVGHGNIKTNAPHLCRDYLFALADRLVHIHLSDNDGQTNNHLPFGASPARGVDIIRELRTIRSFGYEGTLTIRVAGDRRWLLACAEIVRAEWPNVH